MTRRERFENTIKHKKTDRPVFDLYGCPQTMICDDCVIEELKKELGITGSGTGEFIDERILERLGTDIRMTGFFPMPKSPHAKKINELTSSDPWGIEYTLINGHYEISKNPLKDMELDEIKEYYFPKAEDIDFSELPKWVQHAKMLYEETDYVVCAQHPVFGIFELGCWMFGFDDFLYRLAAEPETVHWFFEKILSYQKKVIETYYGALGKFIHVTTSGDDFGTQHGMFMSKSMFEQSIAPYFKERISYTKKFTNAYYQHHTCGSVFELIPVLIECGVDIINPIQPGAHLMEPERLQKEYGENICFWGGVDTQDLLVNGTPDQVQAEVQKLCKIFSVKSGIIISPAHCIQSDVPVKNLIAIYQSIK